MHSLDQGRIEGAHQGIRRRVRRVFQSDRVAAWVAPPPIDLDSEPVWEWVRGILPAEANQRAEITCESWSHPRLRVQIVTDANGRLVVANRAVLRRVMRLIDSEATVVVQVHSIDVASESRSAPAADDAPATIRIWLFNRHGPRAVEADTVQKILLPDERDAYTESGARFETGWRITGEPGGRAAGSTARRLGGRAVHSGAGRHLRWPTAHRLGA